jgi:hypothetical protein
VGQHGALGDTGGAAGVLQERDVVVGQLHGLHPLCSSFLERLPEAFHSRKAVGLYLFALLAHHPVDYGALGKAEHFADAGDDNVLDGRVREDFLQYMREVLEDHDGGRARISELMLELTSRVQRIGVDDGQAGTQRAMHGDWVLQAIRHHQRDAVAFL